MKKWVKITLWSLFLIGIAVIVYYINDHLKKEVIPEPEIIIHVKGENAFITNDELLNKLKRHGLIYPGQKREEIKIAEIEEYISGISQVKSASVFQYINGNWKIEVEIRNPIARIFNSVDETFYLDDEGVIMSTTPSHASRILVFTGNIDDRKTSISVPEIINNDSLISIRKLDDIYRISNYVCKDPFFHSLIGQIHLEKNGDFILVPLVGDQRIVLGSAFSEREVERKFKKLRIFYDEAISYEGWNTYSEISLKYKGQIVCKKKNTDE